MLKLVFYVPESHLSQVKEAVFLAGAGKIGEYRSCCWQVLGCGQFTPSAAAQPFLGEPEKLQEVAEWRVEMVLEARFKMPVYQALKKAHPYEEPAFDFMKIENSFSGEEAELDYYVADSAVHGKGLYAGRDLKKGESLGFCTVKRSLSNGPHVLWAEVAGEEAGFEVLCDLRFINHASLPNVAYYDDFSVVALKKTKKGEELLHDYGEGFVAG